MGYGRRRLFRNLLGSLAVGGVVAAIGLGLPAINNDIPAVRPVSSTQAYLVGGGVTVLPPSHASLDATATQPGSTAGTVLFLLGGVRFAIVVLPFSGSLSDAAASLRRKITNTRGYQVADAESPVTTRAGVPGRQGMYASSGRDGCYAVFLSGGVVAEVTVAGSDMELRPLMRSIVTSVRSIVFGRS